jgi:hypothetical protein
VCSSVGRAILQAKMGPVEILRDILGGYLYNTMKISNLRKEEEERGLAIGTGAVEVSFQNAYNSSDCKVEVILSTRAGQYIWAELYPLVD